MPKHLNITVSGLVHGVSFRYYAREQAQALGVVGFIKNMSNDAVYIEVEGEGRAVDKFLDWCKQGPALARVEGLEAHEGKFKGYHEFKIEF